MSVRRRIGLVLAATLGVGAVGVMAQSSRSPIVRWGDRLESLEPSRAMAYFELAEEVADAAGTPAEHALARKLFALAGALAPESLGRSACLALADLEESDTERRRLLALATLLGETGAGELPDELDPLRDPPLEALEGVTEAFSHYRKGQGSRAMSALRTEGADELLDACDRLLPGGAARFREDCRNYRGQLRPSLSDGEFNRLLRLEIGLLADAERPWSSELLLSRGEPLIEVDPDHLAESIGADVKHPVFRDGQWSEAR